MVRWLVSVGCLLFLIGCEETTEVRDAASPDADRGIDAQAGDSAVDAGRFLDTGSDSSADARSSDAATFVAEGELGVGEDLTRLRAPNFDCLGERDMPPRGAERTHTARVVDAFSDPEARVAELQVQYFIDNEPSLDRGCGSDCVSGTSDSLGELSVSDSGGWVAARILAGEGASAGVRANYATTIEQFLGVTPDEVTMLRAATVNDLNITTALGASTRQPDTAMVFGRAVDCNGDPLANATVRVFTEAGSQVMFRTSAPNPNDFYYDSESFVDSSRRASHVDGGFGVLNLPAAITLHYRVEAWGLRGGVMNRVGCERVVVDPDGATFLSVGPLRADGFDGCESD